MSEDLITWNPDTLGGIACVRDLPIPVARIAALAAQGLDHAEIRRLYPALEEADVQAALDRWAEAQRNPGWLPMTESVEDLWQWHLTEMLNTLECASLPYAELMRRNPDGVYTDVEISREVDDRFDWLKTFHGSSLTPRTLAALDAVNEACAAACSDESGGFYRDYGTWREVRRLARDAREELSGVRQNIVSRQLLALQRSQALVATASAASAYAAWAAGTWLIIGASGFFGTIGSPLGPILFVLVLLGLVLVGWGWSCVRGNSPDPALLDYQLESSDDRVRAREGPDEPWEEVTRWEIKDLVEEPDGERLVFPERYGGIVAIPAAIEDREIVRARLARWRPIRAGTPSPSIGSEWMSWKFAAAALAIEGLLLLV